MKKGLITIDDKSWCVFFVSEPTHEHVYYIKNLANSNKVIHKQDLNEFTANLQRSDGEFLVSVDKFVVCHIQSLNYIECLYEHDALQ